MKDKIVVLDTNVLLHDPEAPHRFGDLRVVIPMQVVEEIDRFKKDHSEKGRNARRISRLLDCLLYTSPSPRDLSTSRMPSSA